MDNTNAKQAFETFLRWEATTRDTIDFKRAYVDMAGDILAGLLLSQIVFWYLPNRQGRSRLAVRHDGYLWIAKAHRAWWEEIRLTEKQARRALSCLEKKGLVITAVYKFDGAPTTHIRINPQAFLDAWQAALQADQNASTCLGGQMDLPPGANGTALEGNSLTKTTTETINTSSNEEVASPSSFSFDEKMSEEKGATPHKSLLQRFNELMTLLEGDANSKEKNAAVTRFYVALFGREAGKRPPYSRVGKLCKKYGHARVAQVLWEVVSKSPRGDSLSYAQAVLRGDKRSERSADSRRKDPLGCEYYEADPNDPDIKAWLEERRKHGTSNQRGGQKNIAGVPAPVPATAGVAGTPAKVPG